VKRDAQNLDKLIRENVDKALSLRKQQFQELTARVREAQDRAATLEQTKKCYSSTINYLEAELSAAREALLSEKEKSELLWEQLNARDF